MRYKRFFYYSRFVLLLILSSACNGKVEPDYFLKWLQDETNGLHVKETIRGFTFDLQYKPWEYAWLQSDLTGLKREEAKKEFEGLQYYSLSIALTDQHTDIIHFNTESQNEVQQSLYYFSYLFQNDIYLEENGKRLPCVLYHFERSVDLKSERTFELGFEKSDSFENANLVIHSDRFDSFPIKIQVSKKNIPELKL